MLAAAIILTNGHWTDSLPLATSAIQRGAGAIIYSYILIPVLCLFLVGFTALILFLIAVLRSRRWERSVATGKQQAWRERHRADGSELPPVDRGMCDRCQRACEKVYYLPQGRRLCPPCYEIEFPLPAVPATGTAKEPT